jgi:tungstate transport system ATP-binding protein
MILAAEGLQVRRGGVPVLDIPALALREGAVLALIGPNGSGKSTLLQTLAGLREADAGRLSFRGQALAGRGSLAAYRQRVTLVFQEPLLFDTTVARNLESGLRLRGMPSAQRDPRVREVARQFGITHLLDRQARKLSGGEAQRASLARAFALRPEILFLDEPFSALDPPTRETLIDDLALALRQTRTTAVLATHDQMEALRLADTLAILNEGRIVQAGSGAEVLNHPADAFVAGFVGMETLLEGVVTESRSGLFRMAVNGRPLEAAGDPPVGATVLVGVRPENVTLSLAQGPPSSARNSFPGVVRRILPRGPLFKVELDCGFFLAALVTPESLETLSLAPGQELLATFKASATHCIRNQSVNI